MLRILASVVFTAVVAAAAAQSCYDKDVAQLAGQYEQLLAQEGFHILQRSTHYLPPDLLHEDSVLVGDSLPELVLVLLASPKVQEVMLELQPGLLEQQETEAPAALPNVRVLRFRPQRQGWHRVHYRVARSSGFESCTCLLIAEGQVGSP